MPWRRPSEAGLGAGFSTAEPWLPVVAEAECLCVEAQQQDPMSTLAFVRELLRLRAGERALHSGTQRLEDAGPGVFCYERRLDQRYLVALNFSSGSVPLGLREDVGPAVVELSTDPGRDRGRVEPRALVLEPDEGVILRLSQP